MKSVLGRLIFAPQAPLSVQKAVQRMLRGPRLTTIRLRNGQRFACLTSEKYYWFGDAYEADERGDLEESLNADSVLYDVGAHAGFWELALAAQCKSVHAFEPSPANFARLERNVLSNGIANVTLVQAAASSAPGRQCIAERGTVSRLSQEGSPVEVITLDDYISRHEPPTVVKIDTEGHGAAVLQGMQRCLAQHRPVLFIELHDPAETAGCDALLRPLGYRGIPLGATGRFPHRVKFAVAGN